jgi:hypothetical protein
MRSANAFLDQEPPVRTSAVTTLQRKPVIVAARAAINKTW